MAGGPDRGVGHPRLAREQRPGHLAGSARRVQRRGPGLRHDGRVRIDQPAASLAELPHRADVARRVDQLELGLGRGRGLRAAPIPASPRSASAASRTMIRSGVSGCRGMNGRGSCPIEAGWLKYSPPLTAPLDPASHSRQYDSRGRCAHDAGDDLRGSRRAAARCRGAGPQPGAGELLIRVRACASAAPTCTSSTARSRSPSAADPRASDRRHRRGARRRRGLAARGRSRRRAVAGLDGWDVRVLHERAREPLPERAFHRPGHRRRVRRVHGRRRALLLSDPGLLRGPAGDAAALRGADRLPRVPHDRRGSPRRLLRLRRLRPHPRPDRPLAGARGLRLHTPRADDAAQAFALELGAVWAGGSDESRRPSWKRRSSSPPSARSCPPRCARWRPAGPWSAPGST